MSTTANMTATTPLSSRCSRRIGAAGEIEQQARTSRPKIEGIDTAEYNAVRPAGVMLRDDVLPGAAAGSRKVQEGPAQIGGSARNLRLRSARSRVSRGFEANVRKLKRNGRRAHDTCNRGHRASSH